MNKTNHLPAVLITGSAIVAIQIGVGVAAYVWLPDWPTRGQFGDVFGATNALFSGLAFAGLIYAILLQREDLALQRKELELTRQELQRSAAAQEQSEVALRAQAAAAAQSARLAALSSALSVTSEALTQARSEIAFSGHAPVNKLLQRKEAITSEILNITEQLCGSHNQG